MLHLMCSYWHLLLMFCSWYYFHLICPTAAPPAIFSLECRGDLVLDSTISISCGLVVQQVVRLAVRLADSYTTGCELLFWTCCWLSSCTTSCTTGPQQIEAMEHRVCHIMPVSHRAYGLYGQVTVETVGWLGAWPCAPYWPYGFFLL